MKRKTLFVVWILACVLGINSASEEGAPKKIGATDLKRESKYTKKTVYKVKRGDTLLGVAERFRVSLVELKKINDLKDGRIRIGQTLIIPSRVKSPDVETTAKEVESPETMAQVVGGETKELTDVPKEKPKPENAPVEEKAEPEEPPSRETVPGEDEEEIVNLQNEMDIRDLIQTVSEITGEAFILDDSVRSKTITIIAPRGGFKKQNALRLFEALLDLNGFAIVKKDGINKVVPKRDIKSESLPTEFGTQFGEPSDKFVTRLVPLKNVNATEVANTLKPLVSKDGDILVHPSLNTLIVIDSVVNLNKILSIIDNIDQQTEIEFIKIENSDASDVAVKLLEIFGGTGSVGRSDTTETPQRRPRVPARLPAQTAVASQGGQSSLAGFKVITDERTNSLIVIAYPEDMQKIKAVIQKLDVEITEPEQGIYVIRLQNADAEQVVGVLSALIGGGGGGVTTQSRRATTGRTSSGIGGTFGRQSRTGLEERQLGSFGQSGDQIERGNGEGLVPGLVAEAEGLRVTADPATNSIIIIGSKRDYETIKSVIDELDVRRKQVFVEAAILEVSLDKLRALGTNFSIGFTINDESLGFGGTALPGIPSLLGAAANTDSLVTSIGGISGLFLGVVGETVDPDGSGPIPPIPSFSALIQALTSLTDVNVLSTPSLLTTDNEEAEIIVADVIPFPTGSTVAETGVTVQTIDRQPVGIRLAITPQISEGDFLNLNIHTEVSAVRDAPAGLNTAQFGIATTTRTADSAVVVKNGQTIVIGGLVQDRESNLENKVPLLGDIPLFGNLFKFRQKTSQKINLMILLTPRIVETESDMQKILEERQKRNMLLQEKGFDAGEQ